MAPKAKTLYRVCRVVQPSYSPRSHSAKANSPVLYTCTCCLAYCPVTAFQQSLSSKLKAMQAFSISGLSSRVLLFGRLEFSFPYSEVVSGQKKVSKTASLTFPPHQPPINLLFCMGTACSSGCLNTQVADSPTAREWLGGREVFSWLLEPAQGRTRRGGGKKEKKKIPTHTPNITRFHSIFKYNWVILYYFQHIAEEWIRTLKGQIL